MGQILETKINNFSGGIVNDPRDKRENTCRMVSNFDVYTNPKKLTPYRDAENGDSGASTRQPQNYLVARRSGSGTTEVYNLLTLGITSGNVAINRKTIETGVTSFDFDDAGWNTLTNGTGAGGTPTYDCFVWYRKTGLVYGFHGGNAIFAVDPADVAAFKNTEVSVTYIRVAQGLVHAKDDILYVPYDNFIATNNNGVWNLTALTLPTQYYITSICEFGNNIAVAMAPTSRAMVGESRVYIWDRNTSITTLSETIPWEEGQLQVLQVVNGYLLGISISGGVQADTITRFRPKILFRYLTGNAIVGFRAEQLILLESPSTTANSVALPIAKQMKDGRLFFMMRAFIDGTSRQGVWSIGKIGDSWSLVHERNPINDTAISTHVSTAPLYNFLYVGDYLFQTYLDSSDAFAVSKTDDQATYTTQAVYESKIFNADDPTFYKRLIEARITHEFLPTAGQVLLLYRINEETVWRRIFTNTTDNSIGHTAVNIEETSDTVTISIASPAVVTLSNHDLSPGQLISFSTTGALPTGITAGTIYYVISASIATGTFEFSATLNGSAVNTSGSQSGTHTLSRAQPLPKQYKEIHFRIESTGNAEITGLSFKEEILTRKYDTV